MPLHAGAGDRNLQMQFGRRAAREQPRVCGGSRPRVEHRITACKGRTPILRRLLGKPLDLPTGTSSGISRSSRSSPGSGSAPTGCPPPPGPGGLPPPARPRVPGGHLATPLALTVLIISSSYARIIQEFPSGGGGYVVATRHSAKAGVVSGTRSWSTRPDHLDPIAPAPTRCSPSCPTAPGPTSRGRGAGDRPARHHEPARGQGVGRRPDAHLPGFPDPHDRHRRDPVQHAGDLRRRLSVQTGLWATCRPSAPALLLSFARLLARRHLHRDRGGVERPRHHAAAGADRVAHHAAHGRLAASPPAASFAYLLLGTTRTMRAETPPSSRSSPAAGRAVTRSSSSAFCRRARSCSSPPRPASSTGRA